MSDMEDYFTYVENKDKTWTGLGLTEKAGVYQGVVYEYGKVSVIENEEKTEASLQFEWNLLDSNGLGKECFGEDFFNLIGDILHHLIEKNITEDGMAYADTDDRTDNIQ